MTMIGSTTGDTRDRDRGAFLSSFAALTSIMAFLFAALGLVVVTAVGPASSSSSGSSGPTKISLSLSELKISPANLSAPAGEIVFAITNSGSMAHNVSVPSLGKKSADLAGGQSGELDLGEVKAGTYEVLCEIPGHAEGGMKATLVVSEGASSSSGDSSSASAASHDSHSTDPADYGAMNAKMRQGMKDGLDTFIKANATKGVGNQKLAPTIEADGTKVFKLVAAITDWEVSPGKTVKAWSYNGMVPGPWIRTEPNDKVKVVIENKLPVDTDIHFHGISVPFNMDGVAPLTQPPVEPGKTFTYEWTNADHPELGMYHAHDHGHIAVLNGLFAVFQVGDVALPAGRTINHVTVPQGRPTHEMPMVLNDAGVIGLSLNGKSYPATAPIVVNPGESMLLHYYNEGLQIHPMHLHRVPQLVVAKDGFPLAEPYLVDTLNIAPGERYSVLIQPNASDAGIWAFHCHILSHAENDQGLFGMVTAMVVGDPAEALATVKKS